MNTTLRISPLILSSAAARRWARRQRFAQQSARAVSVLFLLSSVLWGAASARAAQFTLTWTDNSTNETGFTIERAPGLNATTGFLVLANVGANVTTYTDASLPAATAYTYRLAAWNAAGKSGYSNSASGTTPVPVPTAPGAPALDAGPAYVPPVVQVTATLTMQGATILAATVNANPAIP